jgi:hypothetical protein
MRVRAGVLWCAIARRIRCAPAAPNRLGMPPSNRARHHAPTRHRSVHVRARGHSHSPKDAGVHVRGGGRSEGPAHDARIASHVSAPQTMRHDQEAGVGFGGRPPEDRFHGKHRPELWRNLDRPDADRLLGSLQHLVGWAIGGQVGQDPVVLLPLLEDGVADRGFQGDQLARSRVGQVRGQGCSEH